MEVKATQKGYYGGQIREPGDRFVIVDEDAFSDEWMDPVNGKKPTRKRRAAASAKVSDKAPEKADDKAPEKTDDKAPEKADDTPTPVDD